MIHDIDESLRELLEARVVRGANIDIAFDLPNSEWSAKRQGPAINVYLYDIREDLERRQVQQEAQFNGNGIVTSRRTPPRKFNLEYMVTAWAQRSEDEHRLLSAIMDAFILSDQFPPEHLKGSAADVGPIRTTIALPFAQGRSLSDLWGALGGSLRPALNLVVTVPIGARVDLHVGPPVLEGPRISVLGPDGEPMAPMRKGVGQRQDPTAPPDVPGEPDVQEPAAAAARPPTREVVDAGRFRRGRQVVELTEDDLAPGRRLGIGTMPRPPSQ